MPPQCRGRPVYEKFFASPLYRLDFYARALYPEPNKKIGRTTVARFCCRGEDSGWPLYRGSALPSYLEKLSVGLSHVEAAPASQGRKIYPFLRTIAPVFVTRMEDGTPANFRQLTTMMDDFEAHVKKTNEKCGEELLRVAKTFSAFKSGIEAGKIMIAQ